MNSLATIAFRTDIGTAIKLDTKQDHQNCSAGVVILTIK